MSDVGFAQLQKLLDMISQAMLSHFSMAILHMCFLLFVYVGIGACLGKMQAMFVQQLSMLWGRQLS